MINSYSKRELLLTLRYCSLPPFRLLKEKKKLTSKVETLTKRNNNLLSKLAIAGPPAQAQAEPQSSHSSSNAPVIPLPASSHGGFERRTSRRLSNVTHEPSESIAEQPSSSVAKPRLSTRPSLPQDTAVDPSRRLSHKRARTISPSFDEIPVTTYIGQKRPLPDDDLAPMATEARFPDMAPLTSRKSSTPPKFASQHNPSSNGASKFADECTTTPRHRRPLQALKTGFTPVRRQNPLPKSQVQPSPIRKSSATRDLSAPVISDVTNSPPKAKRALVLDPATEARPKPSNNRGWLDKLQSRGLGSNPLSRTRQRSDDREHS
jgi:hypothetical protein